MEFPHVLREAVEQLALKTELPKITMEAQKLSARYRENERSSGRLLATENEALAYAAARMPATFGAVFSALAWSLEHLSCCPKTLLDIGAGTGSASWAASELLDLENVFCMEREEVMRRLGLKLMQSGSKVLQNAQWQKWDAVNDAIGEQADLVIASYVLNEINESDRAEFVEKLWNAAKMLLLIVEPGTPAGYANSISTRNLLLGHGAEIVAPCPHDSYCPLKQDDWCHFACRVQRSALHKRLKGGDAPYEDEKFSYIAFAKKGYINKEPALSRVLRHPIINSGHVSLDICGKNGLNKLTVSKKDGELYKRARKIKAGDRL